MLLPCTLFLKWAYLFSSIFYDQHVLNISHHIHERNLDYDYHRFNIHIERIRNKSSWYDTKKHIIIKFTRSHRRNVKTPFKKNSIDIEKILFKNMSSLFEANNIYPGLLY